MEALLFDVGGTLVMPGFARIAEELAAEGLTVSAADLAAAEPHARFAIDRADLIGRTRDATRWGDFFQAIVRAAGLPGIPEPALARLRAYHDAHNLWDHVPEEVPAVLAALRGKRRLAVISNSNGTVEQKLRELGLADPFEVILDSAVEGIEKPDPRLFHLALERLGIAPGEAAYVGDLYHVDVIGARAAGLHPILLDPAGLHADKDCARIASLRELVP